MAQTVEASELGGAHIWAMNYIPPTSRRRLPGREAYVVTALRRKLAELKGLALHGDNQAPASIDHVTATLLLFKPDEDIDAIPAVRPYKGARESWLPTALTFLRKEGRPMKAREIALR